MASYSGNFRPGGMSDSEESDDEFFDYSSRSRTENKENTPKEPLVYVEEKTPNEVREEYYYNEVHETIRNDGDLDILENAFGTGILSVNAVRNEGWSFLHFAVKEGSTKFIEYLLRNGARPNYKAKDGFTPFMSIFQCAKRADFELMNQCLEILRGAGANLTLEYAQLSPVMFAAKDNLPELAEYFLDLGVDVNKTDADGQTALHLAAALGHGRVIRVLLMRDADVKLIDENGQTPYEIAATKNFPEVSEILYRVGSTNWRPGCDPALLKELKDPAAVPDDKKKMSKTYIAQKEHIEMTLDRLGLGYLIPMFKKHKINYLTFLRLTEEQLQSMGIEEVGTRYKILDAIRTLHNAPWNPASVNSLFLKGNITSPEVVCMLNDIRGHIQFMTESMGYLLIRLKKEPKVLQAGAEFTKASHLKGYADATLEATDHLRTETIKLRQLFEVAEGDTEFMIGDSVVKPGRKWKMLMLAFAASLIPPILFIIKKK